MNSSLLEIVELPDGDFVLRRAGESDSEPLCQIRFSSEAGDYLPEERLEVAKAMIQAGIEVAAELHGGEAELDFIGSEEEDYEGPRILH